MSEQALIERARRGDPAAERCLYDAHVDRVFRLAYRMTGDDALARDLTQDTFLRAFSRLDGFRGDSAFGSWLHAIAVSVILNGLRRIKRIRGRERGCEDLEAMGGKDSIRDPRFKVMHEGEVFLRHGTFGQLLRYGALFLRWTEWLAKALMKRFLR